jgi:hypothetical protein
MISPLASLRLYRGDELREELRLEPSNRLTPRAVYLLPEQLLPSFSQSTALAQKVVACA